MVRAAELEELHLELELDEEALDAVRAALAEADVEIEADPVDPVDARARPHAFERRHDREPAAVPQRNRPLPAADRLRGGRSRQARRARRPRRQGADGQLEPSPGRLDRQALPRSRPAAARPDPGGHDRAQPRGREVRLAQGLQVLHLRDLVDPPVLPAGGRQPGGHDPRPGARRRAAPEAPPRAAALRDVARPDADAGGACGGDAAAAEARRGGARGRRGVGLAEPDGRRRRRGARRPARRPQRRRPAGDRRGRARAGSRARRARVACPSGSGA